MTNKEINEALAVLGATTQHLEDAFIENDGECTEETDALESQKAALEDLLTGEGIDSLGRWLKGKEDERKAIQDEKRMLDRQMKAIDNTIDYIKSQIRRIMDAAGEDKIKGRCYSFTASVSDTVKADDKRIAELYGDRASFAVHAAGVPDYVTVKLVGSATAAKKLDELPDVFVRTVENTVRFNKPRKSEETEA